MVPIGQLQQSGTFFINTPTPTATGGQKDAYTSVLSTRGRLRQLSQSRTTNAAEIELQGRFEWICRFQTGLTINKRSKWHIEGKEFFIQSYELIDMKQSWYKFILTASE